MKPQRIFLVSYPRSGSNWLAYCTTNLLNSKINTFETPNYIFSKAHSFNSMDQNYDGKIMLIIRNYKECIYRHHEHSENDLTTQSYFHLITSEINNNPNNPNNYIASILGFDKYTYPKFLTYYEDIISDTPKELKKLFDFLEIENIKVYNDFIENLEYHKQKSFDLHHVSSKTHGEVSKNKFYSQDKPLEQKQEIDKYIEEHFPSMWEKYLKRYKE